MREFGLKFAVLLDHLLTMIERDEERHSQGMGNSTDVEGREPSCPVGLPEPLVPAPLKGTRAAIFHLLRGVAPPNDAGEPAPPPVVAVQAVEAPARKPAPASTHRINGIDEFIHGDQFEFLSGETRGAAVRNVSVRCNHPAPSGNVRTAS